MEEVTHPSITTPATRTRRRCHGQTNVLPIIAIVAGFIIWWPLGLAAVAWLIWRDRSGSTAVSRRPTSIGNPLNIAKIIPNRSNNSALADYLERERERLRAEQTKLDELITAFDAFKEAERRTADQRDFDSFMRQHANDAKGSGDSTDRN